MSAGKFVQEWLDIKWHEEKERRKNDQRLASIKEACLSDDPLIILPVSGGGTREVDAGISHYLDIRTRGKKDLSGKEVYVVKNYDNTHWDFTKVSFESEGSQAVSNNGGEDNACGAYTLVGIIARSQKLRSSKGVAAVLDAMGSERRFEGESEDGFTTRKAAAQAIMALFREFSSDSNCKAGTNDGLAPNHVRLFVAWAMHLLLLRNGNEKRNGESINTRIQSVLASGYMLENVDLEIACEFLGIEICTVHDLSSETEQEYKKNVYQRLRNRRDEGSLGDVQGFTEFCSKKGTDFATAMRMTGGGQLSLQPSLGVHQPGNGSESKIAPSVKDGGAALSTSVRQPVGGKVSELVGAKPTSSVATTQMLAESFSNYSRVSDVKYKKNSNRVFVRPLFKVTGMNDVNGVEASRIGKSFDLSIVAPLSSASNQATKKINGLGELRGVILEILTTSADQYNLLNNEKRGVAILLAIKHGGIGSAKPGAIEADLAKVYKNENVTAIAKQMRNFSRDFQAACKQRGILTGRESSEVGARLKRLDPSYALHFLNMDKGKKDADAQRLLQFCDKEGGFGIEPVEKGRPR